MIPSAKSPPPLTLVSAADEKFWRCLWQLLRCLERRRLHPQLRVRIGDLGLAPARRAALVRRFPWCVIVPFDFTRQPAHVARLANYAWKPIFVAQEFQEAPGDLLWLDSATLLHDDLAPFEAALARHEVYTLAGQATVRERVDARVLQLLGVSPATAALPERFAGLVGFAGRSTLARSVAAEWRELALRPELIDPPRPYQGRHMWDQALLTVLLHARAERGEHTLPAGAIDISCADPVRWLSSRNKLRPTVPTWLDPLVRAYFRTWKWADRQVIRSRKFYATRVRAVGR